MGYWVGKSTLMKIMSNMIPNYDGQITINGEDIKDNAQALSNMIYVGGSIYQYSEFYQGQIIKLLKVYDQLYQNFDLKFAKSLIQNFDIDPMQKFPKLSTGNKTLVQNIIGLASQAPITLLDEPTNGLDSVNRQKFFNYMMQDYANNARMFILSTHLINEVENYLTHVMILKDKNVLLSESIESIQNKAFRIENVKPKEKTIIHQDNLGPYAVYDVYDELTDQDQQNIIRAGGKVSRLKLQNLFNDLMEG